MFQLDLRWFQHAQSFPVSGPAISANGAARSDTPSGNARNGRISNLGHNRCEPLMREASCTCVCATGREVRQRLHPFSCRIGLLGCACRAELVDLRLPRCHRCLKSRAGGGPDGNDRAPTRFEVVPALADSPCVLTCNGTGQAVCLRGKSSGKLVDLSRLTVPAFTPQVAKSVSAVNQSAV